MPNEADKAFPTISKKGDWHRLIPSRFPTIDLYRRVAPREHWPLAQAIESMTNPRLRSKERLTKGAAPVVESSPKLQNWNHAPYAYRNPFGSWFLDESIGVLEVSETVQGALAVSIRKREAFLAANNMPALDLEMRVLRHRVHGEFIDARSLPLETTLSERRKIGRPAFEAGAAGVLFRCPHRPCGDDLAIFTTEVLGRAIQAQHYKFRWDGERISEIYDFRD